jgi:hypothetical protein
VSKPILEGDYVLATKWNDGDPQDHWAVGFYKYRIARPVASDRHIVVDSEGVPFRASGFRRVKKITPARGQWLLERSAEIEMSGRSVWGWLRKPMNPRAADINPGEQKPKELCHD